LSQRDENKPMTRLIPLFPVAAILLAVAVAVAGCAGSYHDYAGGCVHCNYCPPPPLPYTTYGYGCETTVAKNWSAADGELPNPAAAGDPNP
jgi:hypothetical protein